MNPDSTEEQTPYTTPYANLIQKIRLSKQGAFWFRKRRQPDWTDNYTLYRDKVQLNRLTQRQSVNIPLIKSTIKTLLKDIDDAPILYFSNLDNDDQAEVFYNEYWKYNTKLNQLVIKDIIDKRQVLLFGRSFKALNIQDGNFTWEVVDPQDMLVDRYVDPSDIDSARVIIREHLYLPLSSLPKNPNYDPNTIKRIAGYMASDQGLIKAEQNQLDWVEKQQRMAAMGVTDTFNPILGETYIELNQCFIKEFNKERGADEITFVVTVEDMDVLYKGALEDYIGTTQDNYWRYHYPFTTWGDETERTDFWSDGVADSLRPLNKILNAWFSQLVENRTLRNFGMNYYNSSLTEEGFTPQTFEPVPWGWYPIPAGGAGKLGDQIMRVEIPDLENTVEDMNFILTIAQQASAATTFQQGVQDKSQPITLGEVQLLLSNAKERVKSMAVYYTASWEDFGQKYVKMLEAGSDLINPLTIHKKGRLTKKNYAKHITPQMWYSKAGHKVDVRMKEDVEAATADSLQKLQYSKSLMPTNNSLDTIIKMKSLEFANLDAAEMSEVLKEDEMQMKQLQEQTAAMAGQGMMAGQGNGQLGQPNPLGQLGQPAPQLQAPGQPVQGQLIHA